MGNMSGSYGSHYTLWQSITQNSQDTANNKSNVTVKLYLSFDGSSYYAYTNYSTSGSMTINGTTHNYSISSINFSSGVAKDILLATWNGDITHNSDGTKSLSVSGNWNTNTDRIGSGTCSASLVLTPIARNFTSAPSISVKSKTLTSITISWSTSETCDRVDYNVSGTSVTSAWAGSAKSGTITISNLKPNISYNIYVWCRRKDSQLGMISSTISTTTYDIAKISSLANFEHGSSPTVGITNPGSISSLSLVMSASNTQILSRTVSAGNNTITFSDTELDNLYKKYGSSNSLTATFVLSGSGYTDSKTCTVTLKGNQKTMRTNVSGSWKRGKLWTNVNGTWKRGVLWTNVNGTWKHGI